MMPISDSTPFAMQAGHFFLNTTFFVVEIFAGRFAAISNILLPGSNPVLWTSMPPGMNYWKTVRLSSPPNRGGKLIALRFATVNLFCLLLALWRRHYSSLCRAISLLLNTPGKTCGFYDCCHILSASGNGSRARSRMLWSAAIARP